MTSLLVTEEALIQLPFPAMSDDQFFDFCASNSDYRIERTAEGRIIIMSGTGGETDDRNRRVTTRLGVWTENDGRGIAFDSSTMFRLPNSAMLSPDAAWVLRARLRSLPQRQRERFLPLCPDFVIELTSPGDRLPKVRAKMAGWIADGCELGWIIHPAKREVHIYRVSGIEVLKDPDEVTGEGPVEGFRLKLTGIWDTGW